jgi:hypothetical protein
MTMDQDTGETKVNESDFEICQPKTEAAIIGAQNTSRLPVEKELFRGSEQEENENTIKPNINGTVGQHASHHAETSATLSDLSNDSVAFRKGSAEGSITVQSMNSIDSSRTSDRWQDDVVDACIGSNSQSKGSSPQIYIGEAAVEAIDGKDSQNSMSKVGGKPVQLAADDGRAEAIVQHSSEKDDGSVPTPLVRSKKDEGPPQDSQEREADKELQSKVIDVESIPMDEMNWLKRLRERPSAIPSSFVAQDVAPTTNSDAAQGEKKGGEEDKDELSYASTLPPESFGGDDVSLENANPTTEGDSVLTTNENQFATTSNPVQNPSRPQRKKRRLPPLKNLNRDNQGPLPLQQQVHPDKAHSRKAKSVAAKLSTVGAPAKPRQKKPATNTVIPEVVPSFALQTAVKQVADFSFDFSKNAPRPPINTHPKRSKTRRKRKGPPSLIILLDGSPVPPSNQQHHHSVVSRGSSHVPKKKSQEEKNKAATDVLGKRRRLKK